MPTFFGRKYGRPAHAVGRKERGLGVLILVLTAAIVATFALTASREEPALFRVDEHADAPAEPGLPTVAPQFADSGLPGWSPPRDVAHFGPDDLYIKIDGRAEAYLARGCRGLTFARYEHEHDAGRAVEVYWYQMETPAGALAMYESERPPEATAVAIGESGYRVGGAVFFHQGNSYVQVLAMSLDPEDEEAARRIAEHLASHQEQG